MVSVRLDELKLIWNWLILNRVTPEIVTGPQDPENNFRHPWQDFDLKRDGLLRVGLSTEWQRSEISSTVDLSFKIQMVLAALENKQLDDFKWANGLPENSVWALARTMKVGAAEEGQGSSKFCMSSMLIGYVLDKIRAEARR